MSTKWRKSLPILVPALALLVAAASCADARSATVHASFSDQVLTWNRLDELTRAADPPVILIDVRTPEEFAAGSIPGSINIPYDRLAAALPTDDRAANIVVYCRSGNRSSIAKRVLAGFGFTSVNDFGGVFRWEGALVRP